jgi:nucleotide-binding universal stress UspA family protein
MNNDSQGQLPLSEAPKLPPPAPKPQAGPSQIRFERILVAADFSACSNKAVEWAAAFALQFQARLWLIHVLELNYVGSGLGEIEAPLLESEQRQNAQQQCSQLTETRLGGVACETVLRPGRPWHEITEAAKELHVDMIIMGTHGYIGFQHVLMGSTAERVVRHAPCPVLVVPQPEQEAGQGRPGGGP